MAWTSPPRTWSTNDVVTATQLNTELRDALKALSPVGQLSYLVRAVTAVETLIEGAWLECNGFAVSRSTYADLFALLNALTPALPFGTGDGSTTFNLPDLRGRMLVGIGTHTDVDALGENEGAVIGDRRPKHQHTTTSPGHGGGSANTVFLSRTAQFNDYGSIAITVGPQTNSPVDAPAFLVAGVWAIKAKI